MTTFGYDVHELQRMMAEPNRGRSGADGKTRPGVDRVHGEGGFGFLLGSTVVVICWI